MACLAALAAVFLLKPVGVWAQVVCPFPAGANWSATVPAVNQDHVFCGEWRNNRPKGFHSRPAGVNPATVGGVAGVTAPNAVGVYNLTWWYVGHPGTTKGSTMFPDGCTQPEVLNSIVYAANHPVACVPAVPWGSCGPNRPNPVPPGGVFCVGAAGAAPWQIRFATVAAGVNTAFPN